jgi:hypothetical protein
LAIALYLEDWVEAGIWMIAGIVAAAKMPISARAISNSTKLKPLCALSNKKPKGVLLQSNHISLLIFIAHFVKNFRDYLKKPFFARARALLNNILGFLSLLTARCPQYR